MSQDIAVNNFDELINAFSDAVNNLMTSENAKFTVSNSEQQLINNIQSLGGDKAYTTAADVPANFVDKLVKESIQVHMGKAQSEQIEHAVAEQIHSLEQQTKEKFIGKKVSIEKLDKSSKAIEAVYLDHPSDYFRFSNYKPLKIKGKIKDLSLSKNLLVIEPSYLARKLTPNRVLFKIHVLNPENLSPQIKIV